MSNLKTIRKKKTIQVSYLREKINKMILFSENKNVNGREALIVLAESILHESGNYRGFGYIDKAVSLTGSTFGVDHSRPEGERFEGTDKTRVHYF